MSFTFEPTSALNLDHLRAYLARHGMSPETIQWKYFDAAFNRGRERGFGWLRHGKLEGFLGLIPSRFAHAGQSWPCSWACDWSLDDPDSTPGMGCLLFKKAVAATENVVSFGGNAYSNRALSRMADRSIPDAARIFQIPVRLDAILEKIARRKRIPLDRIPLLGRFPLRTGRRRPDARARTAEGLPREIAPLLEPPPDNLWRPLNDFDYVHWQIARCPLLTSATTFAPAEHPGAAVLLWHRKLRPPRAWRAAVWMRPGAADCLAAALDQALRLVYDRGAALLSCQLSRLDSEQIAVVSPYARLLPQGSNALHFFSAAGPPVNELANLSFIDSDLATLF